MYLSLFQQLFKILLWRHKELKLVLQIGLTVKPLFERHLYLNATLMNSSILAIVTAEIPFLGVRREEWVVELLVMFRRWEVPVVFLNGLMAVALTPTTLLVVILFE